MSFLPEFRPNSGASNFQKFTAIGDLANADLQQWIMFSDIAWAVRLSLSTLGPGAGAGRGGTGANSAGVNGGNSGGGGGYTEAEYLLQDLIDKGGDRILIIAGKGGLGEAGTSVNSTAASTQGGTNGSSTRIELWNGATRLEILCFAAGGINNASATGWFFGAVKRDGTTGQATAANITNEVPLNQAGAAGSPGSGITAANVAAAASMGTPGMYTQRRNVVVSLANSGSSDFLGYRAGNSGFGGPSSLAANGGDGGNGGPGCGGGGGGACRNGFTSGKGGDGGPGIGRVVALG